MEISPSSSSEPMVLTSELSVSSSLVAGSGSPPGETAARSVADPACCGSLLLSSGLRVHCLFLLALEDRLLLPWLLLFRLGLAPPLGRRLLLLRRLSLRRLELRCLPLD